MEPVNERTRAAAGFLRQLWFGLATYRLYPDSPIRSGFQATADQIGAAARAVLHAGTFEIEISASGFVASSLELPSDPALGRLARVCFERRAELLRLTAPPSVDDLATIFAALATPVDEVDRAGGLEAVLSDVTSIELLRLGPTRVPGARGPVPADDVTEPVHASSAGLELGSLGEGLTGSLDERADRVLDRLRKASASVGASASVSASGPDLYADLCGALVVLPEDLRRVVIGRLVGEGPADPLAQRLIGSLSNAELSRALVRSGGAGREPVEMARRLADVGIRMPDIVDFTAALQAGFEDGSTILAGLEQIGTPVEGFEPGSSVADALGEHLLASEPADLRSLRELSAATDQQATAVGLATLRDYLALEDETEQFETVGEVWGETTRAALLRRDYVRVMELVSAVESSSDPRDGRAFLEVFTPLVIDADVVSALVAEDAPDQTAFLLLAPFGESAVEVLFDELAEEPDRGRRAVLLGLLRQLAPGRAEPIVRRLDDARWYVVRNAVNVLRYSRHPSSFDLMARAAQHAAEGVRREAVFGLAAGGEAAVPFLGQLAVGPDASVRRLAIQALHGLAVPEAAGALAKAVHQGRDMQTRRLALETLAAHPSSEAGQALTQLASRTGGRLPFSLRRRVRACVRERSRSMA